MAAGSREKAADQSQRRASFQQARSHQTKRVLVQAAVNLWRANGYANTTIADICRAAGVSKGLFYFYFPRKEDVLLELGILSSRTVQRLIHDLLRKPYELSTVIQAALGRLERSMQSNPPELIIEAVLEGYRYEYRLLTGEESVDAPAFLFAELFERGQADGKIPAHVDVAHLARLAQSLVSEGTRHWAAGEYAGRSFAQVVGRDVALLIAGFSHLDG